MILVDQVLNHFLRVLVVLEQRTCNLEIMQVFVFVSKVSRQHFRKLMPIEVSVCSARLLEVKDLSSCHCKRLTPFERRITSSPILHHFFSIILDDMSGFESNSVCS